MKASASKKSGILTPTKMCECCGRFVVYLRDLNGTDHRPIWRICYYKGWDGNPYFNSAIHFRHPAARWVKRMCTSQDEVHVDPFFTLD